ncbi:hypothetical protein [Paenibacillus sp. GP183]|uniref:hypothetical protein n=1 Tax=Paenibacillus sp. GP183 TaxID=1882751 RepID=UPI0008965EA0|nr:hypothetical protein [Paenibacillus sp. GP183]SEC15674.1 hypothetical protein SAMN05443246_3176 [Paenibacillus sp. GP183]
MAKHQRKDKWIDYFEIALYALAAICFVYFLTRGVRSKILEPVLIVVVLLILRGVVKITKAELFPALRLSILLFIFVTMFLANEFGFYGIIPELDKIEHLFSGLILCFVGLLIYKKMLSKEESAQSHPKIALWFSLFFSVAMAGCWEIYEYTTDHLFGLNSQRGSLDDTMLDIISGTIGAVLTTVYLAYKAKRKDLPI